MGHTDKAVRAHYEDCPYPPRNPIDERARLLTTYVDHLDLINHYAFGGQRHFSSQFRALVAGGGTGDATLFLAEQLRPLGGHVVHLDISQASIDVAKARARERKLDNIEFTRASLLEISGLSLGLFDYINCCGVLHHLGAPLAGLRALKTALAPGGAMGLMLYGRYGREPILQFRKALEALIDPQDTLEERLSCCRALLRSLPVTNSLSSDFYGIDPDGTTDTELADLFLNPRETSFSVEEVYEFVENAGLELSSFVCERGIAKSLYDPTTYVQAPQALARIDKLSKRSREALAEVLLGVMVKHAFFVSEVTTTPPSPRNGEMIPFLSLQYGKDPEGYSKMARTVRESSKSSVEIRAEHLSATTVIENNPLTPIVLESIDGIRTIDEIVSRVQTKAQSHLAEQGLEGEDASSYILDEVERVFNSLSRFDWMLLRHKESPSINLPMTPK